MIGLGIMGSAMSANLMRAGYPVIGYDVLARRRQGAGGQVAANGRAVAKRAAVIVCPLPSSQALLETALELAESSRRPQIVIETSTLPIEVKDDARRRLSARGATLLDCPLSGTGAQARKKDLVVYASGDRGAYRRTVPILEAFARAHFAEGHEDHCGFCAAGRVPDAPVCGQRSHLAEAGASCEGGSRTLRLRKTTPLT